MKTLGLKYNTYEIIEKEILTLDTAFFKLSGHFDFTPGQFAQILLPHYGEGTFGICNKSSDKDTFEICVRACGNLSNQIIKLVPGDSLSIRGPYGNGWPVGKLIGKEIIIIAGGMGLVPFRSLLFDLLEFRGEFKKISLIAGFKTDKHVIFESDLQAWQKKVNLNLYVEHSRKGFWGNNGLITKPLEELKINPKKTIVLICGPEVMFKFCNDILIKKGVSEENIYMSFERRMECGIGICQHCNIGKYLVCADGPIFPLSIIKNEIGK